MVLEVIIGTVIGAVCASAVYEAVFISRFRLKLLELQTKPRSNKLKPIEIKNVALEREFEKLKVKVAEAESRRQIAETDNARLRAALIVASKNDQRDSKGKYTQVTK